MNSEYIRKELVRLLRSGGAHASFDDIVQGFPLKLQGLKPSGSPHSAWQLLEHMRLAQWDILEFTRDPNHVSLEFPAGYWPKVDAPATGMGWEESISAFKKDLQGMEDLIKSDDSDLFARLPHGNGGTIYSQALLLVDHNSYHFGQLMLIRRSLE